jgi:hypothetical protein
MGRDNSSHGSQGRGGGGRGDRSQGRQGRFSRSRFNNNKKTKTTTQIEYKFTPHTTSKTRRATFSTVKDHLVNKIQRDFKGGKDIADSLIAMQKVDLSQYMPIMQTSTKKDDTARANEQKQFDMIYRAKIEKFIERETDLEQGMPKAYSLIYSTYCTTTMQTRIEEHKDYEFTIKNDPIKLLEAIQVLMQNPIVNEDHNQKTTMDPELEVRHNLFIQSKSKKVKQDFYTEGQVLLIAHLMVEMDHKAANAGGAAHFAQQYILQKGLKKFGQKGSDAATKELKQLHDCVCFEPISIADMSQSEIRKSMEALMLLTEKRDGTIKGRMVYNGKPTREWLSREDSTSPTVSLESLIITAVIDAYEGHDVMTADVPNAFIQTVMPQPTDGSDDWVCMKITGVLVDLLCKLDPTKYGPYVVFEKGCKVLYVLVLRAIYGMLVASLL